MRVPREQIDRILAQYSQVNLDPDFWGELVAFQLEECLPDLIAFVDIVERLPTLVTEEDFARKSHARRAFRGLIMHGTNHVIAAARLVNSHGLTDKYGLSIWDDEDAYPPGQMYRPCPEEECERPIQDCVCRKFAPIPGKELGDVERFVYCLVFKGDANRINIAKASDHLNQMRPFILNFVGMFLEPQNAGPLSKDAGEQRFKDFFGLVPEHLAAIRKIASGLALEDLFGVGVRS